MTRQPGPGVDAEGVAVIDPTQNVLALVDAAVRRQDDLRDMESRHLRDLIDRDAAHAAELRLAEAARLDAIRVVDVNAVQRAAEVMATQATTLANVVATSAEALRTQVATTATGNATALAAALDPIVKDIADLRRVQYEAAGGQASTREGAGDRRSSLGLIVAGVGLASAILFSIVGVALTLLLRSG